MPERFDLPVLADALVGVESSSLLISRLEELLERLEAAPAILYMSDMRAGVFYPAVGLGRSLDGEGDLTVAAALDTRPGQHLLFQHGDPVGLLVCAGTNAGHPAVAQVAALLGPALVGVHHQELTLRELRQTHGHLKRLVDAGKLLRQLDLERLLADIMQLVLEAVSAQVGALLVPDDAGQLQPRVAWGLRDDHLACLRLRDGTLIAEQVFGAGQPQRFNAAGLHEQLDLSGLDAQLTGLLVLPVRSQERSLGVILAANPEEGFSAEDERLAVMVSDLAAVAMDNATMVKAMVDRERMRHDFEVARQVQARMSPERSLAIGSLTACGSTHPSEETGGDYYTYLDRGGRMIAVIGDVTGHGLGAALFTTVAHAIIQYQFRTAAPLEAGFSVLNQGLYHTHSGRFMTAAVVELDPENGEFIYASAGHNPLLWLHEGAAVWLDSTGMPLGILEDNPVPAEAPRRMSPGDVLVLYTDGVTEAMNPTGTYFGEEALAETCLDALRRGLDGAGMQQLIEDQLRAWHGGGAPGDDVTMIIISWRGPAAAG
jgi:serine phosphatase RsbU (regulator of sigma subunit)